MGGLRLVGQQRIALMICLIAVLSARTVAVPIIDSNVQMRIDQIVNDAIAEHCTPGAALVIGTAKGIIYSKGYGRLTYDLDSASVTLDTMWDLASCSKATATTIATLLLIQDGKLGLDDHVFKFLPMFDTEDKRAITIRHLLSHTSGLPAYTNAEKVEADRRPGESRADALIRWIANLPLVYKTGEGLRYSCLNFIVLARVNEEVSGVSQETLLRRRVFVPLRMLNSGYYLSERQKALCAPTVGKPNFRQGVVHDPLAYYLQSHGYHCSGNAGFFSSANDLSNLCRMILSNGSWEGRCILRPEIVDLIFTNQVPQSLGVSRGAGWALYSRYPYATELNVGPQKACVGHDGYTGTYIHLDRMSGTFLIILTNRVYPDDTARLNLARPILTILRQSDPLYTAMN